MIYKNIPQTELNPSVICLGTVPFGKGITESESFKLMDTYYGLGGNFIDTANIYSDWEPGEKGASEKTIGKWLRTRNNRNKIILGTKGGHPDLNNMNIPRITYKDINTDLVVSLKRLQTDYIDIYWLHRDDINQPVEYIIDIMNKFVKEGKIRYFGCSNWKSNRIQQANNYAKTKNEHGFIANQLWWNLAKINWENVADKTLVYMDDIELKFHNETKLPVAAYSAQANGFFGGAYGKGIMNPKTISGATVIKFYYNETNFKILEKVKYLAKQKNRSPNQIALAYLLNQDFIVFPIIGCRTEEQIKEACLSVDIKLSKGELNYLKDTDN